MTVGTETESEYPELSQPPPKRARLVSPPRLTQHPLAILPQGNALLNAALPSIRSSGLGSLSCLTDTLLLDILSQLTPRDLNTIQLSSKPLFALCRHEPSWKDLYVLHSEGRLEKWLGSWRKTLLGQFCASKDRPRPTEWPADEIKTPGFYSDTLYHPYFCAHAPLDHYFYSRGRPRSNFPRVGMDSITMTDFSVKYAKPSRPVILTDALHSWPSFSQSLWTLPRLRSRFSQALFRAEAFDCTLDTYMDYADHCDHEDSPLYLFDSHFVEKTGGEMGNEYTPPEIFSRDLFDLMELERPNFRWLIIGPARSGSTFHKDPNSTSAWNAVLSGRKGWIMFPPDVLPPGVYVNEDESEVTSPLSITEWFLSYFDTAWEAYGPNASDPKTRGKMIVGVCESNQIVYVPSGWWHLVVNLEHSVAVTQNFVSEHEVVNVLEFMRDKPDQISGFHIPPGRCNQLYDQFTSLLQRQETEIYRAAHEELFRRKKPKQSLWDKMANTVEKKEVITGGAFSFNFGLDAEEIGTP